MTPVCPFVKAARPDDTSSKKSGENSVKHQAASESKAKKDSNNSAGASPKCPFGYDSPAKKESDSSASASPKCPFGYDSQTFKIGPLSCMICQALLFETSKCVPCCHVFCKACISRFKDCPLCGADIEKIEPDANLQGTVDRFIEGHARIKRSISSDKGEETEENKPVIYEDVSLERGSFLVQQAMRAFRAQNIESAKSRLSLCAEDIRGQLEKIGNTSELCSQLGAVLGMLGDCWIFSLSSIGLSFKIDTLRRMKFCTSIKYQAELPLIEEKQITIVRGMNACLKNDEMILIRILLFLIKNSAKAWKKLQKK
ncbi:protein NCA1-like isoform X2 [Prosopis cineraria]|uniref:protein NCA1-like isoform X2 n=1 Tax=Prosopis cineraria TaxID=364024 RepID=UPI00240F8D1F|nr:protein NCA1-like isoform X2 [Prosopis cineraria]